MEPDTQVTILINNYAQIRGKSRKSYIKNHIAINVYTRTILNYAANKCLNHDTQFTLTSIRQLKLYKLYYILADKHMIQKK